MLPQPDGAVPAAALNGASHLGSEAGKHGQHRRRPLTAKTTLANPAVASSSALAKGASIAWLQLTSHVLLRPLL